MNPGLDEAFEGLVAGWSDGSLGLDKHEGLGLLWKEGLISSLLMDLFRRAPLTMRALGARLAEGAPPFGADHEYLPRRLVAEFVGLMDLPYTARRERCDVLDLPLPPQQAVDVFAELDPPMQRRFRSAIESWLDTAAAIEARIGTSPAVPTFGVGAKVRHAQWGEGVIRALKPGAKPLATVEFEQHGQKKLLVSFLELIVGASLD